MPCIGPRRMAATRAGWRHIRISRGTELLRQALADNRVRQASQPIVDLQSGRTIADEALARVGTSSGDIVEARDFVDMAEGLAESTRMLADMGVDYGRGWYFGRPQLAGS